MSVDNIDDKLVLDLMRINCDSMPLKKCFETYNMTLDKLQRYKETLHERMKLSPNRLDDVLEYDNKRYDRMGDSPYELMMNQDKMQTMRAQNNDYDQVEQDYRMDPVEQMRILKEMYQRDRNVYKKSPGSKLRRLVGVMNGRKMPAPYVKGFYGKSKSKSKGGKKKTKKRKQSKKSKKV